MKTKIILLAAILINAVHVKIYLDSPLIAEEDLLVYEPEYSFKVSLRFLLFSFKKAVLF